MRCLAHTGLRWGEYDRLDRFDLVDPIVAGGKGRIMLDKTKTDTPRTVPIPAELVKELRALLSMKAKPKYKTMALHLSEAVKSCGLAPAFTIHCLRHTTATRLAIQGENESKIMSLMGHSSPLTTKKYIHLAAQFLEEVAGKLWGARGGIDEIAYVPILKAM